MKKQLGAMPVRTLLFGLVLGLSAASASALPPGGGGGGGHVCVIDPANTDHYLACVSWLPASFCCAVYGI